MQHSESIANLAAALSAAQGQFPSVTKGEKANLGKYSYSYADLASYLDVVRAPLAANGLAVLQFPELQDGMLTVETLLAHASGEWVRSVLSFPVTDDSPQKLGGLITYCRRYALAPILGLASEDDDAQGKQRQAPAKWQAAPAAPEPAQPEPQPSGPMTPTQLTTWLRDAAKAAETDGSSNLSDNWKGAIRGHIGKLFAGQAKPFLAEVYGVESSKDLSEGQWKALLRWLNIRQAEDGQWHADDLAVAESKLWVAEH